MSGPVTSIFKITFDPEGRNLVLLNFGDRLMEEPQFSHRASPQELTPLESDTGNVYATGGMLGTITWTGQSNFATHSGAAFAALAGAHMLPWGDTKPLDVEIKNETGGTNVILRYAQAAFSVREPSYPMTPTGGRIALSFSLSLGGGMTPIQGIDDLAGGVPIEWSMTPIEDLEPTTIENL